MAYPDRTRLNAIDLYEELGSILQVHIETGIPTSTLSDWVQNGPKKQQQGRLRSFKTIRRPLPKVSQR